MKYLKIFETEAEYTNYYKNGVPSGVLVYVKETNKSIFSTNNIEGNEKQYEMVSSDNIEDLNDTIDELNTQIENLQSDNDTLQHNIENLETEKTDLQNEIDSLKTEKTSLEMQLSDKDNEIISLNDRISELDANQESHEITFDESTKTLSVNDI